MTGKAATSRAHNRGSRDGAGLFFQLIGKMRVPIGSLAVVSVLGANLLLAATSNASPAPAQLESAPLPIDFLDWYVGAVDTSRCCDCHSTVC